MKYRGQNIELNEEGKIVCYELGLEGDTVDEVKKAIRAQEKIQEAKPKTNILYHQSSWGEKKFIQAVATGTATSQDRYERIWISYTDERGRTKKEKVYVSDLYLDTTTNREIAYQIQQLNAQRSALQEEINKQQGRMEKFK